MNTVIKTLSIMAIIFALTGIGYTLGEYAGRQHAPRYLVTENSITYEINHNYKVISENAARAHIYTVNPESGPL